MVKKKKTIEESLEEALVPVEEQPYEIPENWVWAKVNSVLYSMKLRDPKKLGSDIFHYIDVDAIDNLNQKVREIKEIETNNAPSRAKRYVSENDVIISLVRPYLRNIAQININDEKLVASTAFYVCSPREYLLSNYLYNFLCSPIVTKYLIDNTRGDNSPSVRSTDFEKLPIPIPPLDEQKRIADKVERLLSKIDEAKQLIEEAKESFEIRRAAILEKAYRGDLTKSWREENSLVEKGTEFIKENKSIDSKIPYSIPTTWKWAEMKDVATFKSGFAFKSKDFVEQGIQLIRMGNLYKNELALDRNPVYMPLDFDTKILEKYTVGNGDILLSLTGTKYKRDYGYAVRVEGVEKTLLLNQRILSLKPHSMHEYIFYYLKSSTFRDVFFSFETGGVNQGNVGSKAVESILIPVPPLEEAKEIEKMLNNLLNNEKKSLKTLFVERELETLKQTILSKAYRGELGTNDSIEENAVELLKEVLQE